jgi:hypothetical protein
MCLCDVAFLLWGEHSGSRQLPIIHLTENNALSADFRVREQFGL